MPYIRLHCSCWWRTKTSANRLWFIQSRWCECVRIQMSFIALQPTWSEAGNHTAQTLPCSLFSPFENEYLPLNGHLANTRTTGQWYTLVRFHHNLLANKGVSTKSIHFCSATTCAIKDKHCWLSLAIIHASDSVQTIDWANCALNYMFFTRCCLCLFI